MDVKSELLLVVLAVVILLWKLDCTCKESDSSIFYYVVITYYRELGICDGDGIWDVLVFYW